MPIREEDSVRELTSWKEIAEFLDVSVRTAQRYEVELGLPVRRLPGEKGRAVAADADDLAAWKRKQVATPPWWRNLEYLRRYAIVTTSLIVALSVYVVRDLAARLGAGKPHDSHWLGATLVVTDASGREVWQKSFERDQRAGYTNSRYHGDLGGDGSVETIVPLLTPGSDLFAGYLCGFSETGVELWRVEPKEAVSDAERKFSSKYMPRDYQVFPSPEGDGTKWVIAAFSHQTDNSGVALLVDARGRRRGQYWSSGHTYDVETMDLDGDGVEEVVLAGTDQETNRAVLRILDPRKMAGAQVAQVLTRGHRNQLVGFGPGTEKATVLFERSRLNRRVGRFNSAYWVGPVPNSPAGEIQVRVSEQLDEAKGYLTYAIGRDLRLVSLVASDSLYNTYLEYSRKDPASPPFGPRDLEDLRRGYTVRR